MPRSLSRQWDCEHGVETIHPFCDTGKSERDSERRPAFTEIVGVADILDGLNQIQNEQDKLRNHFEQLLDLLAEAQSALRVAIADIDGPIDLDQCLVFSWLKTTATESQTFIQSAKPTNSRYWPQRQTNLWPKVCLKAIASRACTKGCKR